MFRSDAGEHADPGESAVELFVVDLVEDRAGHRLPGEAELAPDRGCSRRVVAGDHLDVEPGSLSFGDRLTGFGPWWIDDPDVRGQRQVVGQPDQVCA